MQCRRLIELEHFVSGNADAWTQASVGGIGVGDDGIQAVVAALQFHKHQQPAVIGAGGRKNKFRQRGTQQTGACRSKELPPAGGGVHLS